MNDAADPDDEVRAAALAHDYERAASLALERYGGEILAFLSARLRNPAHGEDVFGAFAEKFWVGLPQFEWRCSLRSWCYRLARNAANDHVALARNRHERNLSLEDHARLSQLVQEVRKRTPTYLRTEMKDRIHELRDTLPPDDQMLLYLRVDRNMSFRELAVVLGEGSQLEDSALERESARLRKRFERVKDQLRELAREKGLL